LALVREASRALLVAVALGLGAEMVTAGRIGAIAAQARGTRQLPAPAERGGLTLEEALRRRRSVRAFASDPVTESQLAQLLWAAQGVTHSAGYRTAPSAGALYPLEIYVATDHEVLQYEPARHRVRAVADEDVRARLRTAALSQPAVGTAPAVFIIVAVVERTAAKYGRSRARRYVQLEAGHAAQNLLLQAVALGLGAVPIGAFDDDAVARNLRLPAGQEPLYLIPVGRPGP
jgi:SagB-type dehydrogenase family enzyme